MASETPAHNQLTLTDTGKQLKQRRGPRYRGYQLLTVLSAAAVIVAGSAIVAVANPPVAGVIRTIVQDPMSRVDRAGWGSAPLGGEYTQLNDGSFSTNGNAGIIRVPGNGTSRTATLSAVTAKDVGATIALVVKKVPLSGGGVATGLQLRSNAGSNYRGDVVVAPVGKATLRISRVNGSAANQTIIDTVELPFSVLSGQLVLLEFQAVGDDNVMLSARAWRGGTPRPAWQISTSDQSTDRLDSAGGVGLWTYVSRGSQRSTVYVDNFTANEMAFASSTPAPTPTPTPTTSPGPEPTPVPGVPEPTEPAPAPAPGSPSSAGSAVVGTTNYPVPANAILVSPSGDDNGAGTIDSPFRTVAKAVSSAPSGATLVLRAGSYHESVTIPDNKRITIQSYPHEAAWFDGSRVVSTWAKAGAAWSSSNWTAQFDSSPTYTFGVNDGAQYGWKFLSPQYPLAANPDQVWIDDVAQVQVGSLGEVKPGKFYVDYATQKLFVGTDPTSRVVRASDIAKAISIRGEGSTLRGVGVRRYAPSVAHMGAVTVEKPNVTVENVVITDTATTGLFVMQSDVIVRDVTLTRNGMLGASMSTADHLTVTGMLASGNNTEHFNNSPVSGGLKISRSRGVKVTNSAFLNNFGPGLWFDESVYDGTVASNDIIGNVGHGLILEISAKFRVVNNLVSGNSDNGMKINNTSQVEIWNNTLTGNGRSLNIVQDTRRARDAAMPGHDPRQQFPDPTMSWINGPVTVRNNVIANPTAANCLICVEDYSRSFTAEQLGVTADGNIYQLGSAGTTQTVAIWSRGGSAASTFSSIADFTRGTGQDNHSIEVIGESVLGPAGGLVDPVAAQTGQVGQPLPPGIASVVGKATGLRYVGIWPR